LTGRERSKGIFGIPLPRFGSTCSRRLGLSTRVKPTTERPIVHYAAPSAIPYARSCPFFFLSIIRSSVPLAFWLWFSVCGATSRGTTTSQECTNEHSDDRTTQNVSVLPPNLRRSNDQKLILRFESSLVGLENPRDQRHRAYCSCTPSWAQSLRGTSTRYAAM